jgi:hypothetical protein
MRYFKLLPLFLLLASVQPLSADPSKLVIADFDDVIPLNLFGWDNQAAQVPNPVPGPLNTSEYVAAWTKCAGQWKGMGFFTKEKIDFSRYPVYTFKLWSPVEGKVMIKFFSDQGGESTKAEFTIPEPMIARQWQVITFDASRLRSGFYDKIEVMTVPESPEKIGPFYFDDFILYPDLKSSRLGAATPAASVPPVAQAVPSAPGSGEMLLNPGFTDGLTNWVVEQSGGAAGQADRVTGPKGNASLRFKVLKIAGEPWRLQIYQKGLAVKKGAGYILTFRVKANRPGELTVNCMQNHEPWEHHAQKKITVATQWEQKRFSFKSPWDDNNVRITFSDLGTAVGQTYWFDDCSLVPAPVEPANAGGIPSGKPVTVWDGEKANVGGAWVNPSSCTMKTQSSETHSGRKALEFRYKGTGEWLGFGWNWCAFQAPPCGTDITGLKYFTFWIKTKGKAADIQFNILCNGHVWDMPEHHTAKVSVQKYCPQFADGKWHQVRVPLDDLVQPDGFDPLHVGELQLFNAGAGDGSFYIDDIGFDNGPDNR